MILKTLSFLHDMDVYTIQALSADFEAGLICELNVSVMHDRVVLGLNSRRMTVSPCPSPLNASVMHDRVVLGFNSRHMTLSRCPSPLGQARERCEQGDEKN